MTERDKGLLALATIIRGVTCLYEDVPGCLTNIKELLSKEGKGRFKALNGFFIRDDEKLLHVIPPWEPDLVGELFVLEYLSNDPDLHINDVRVPVLVYAWGVNPLATSQFLYRLIQDYGTHVSIQDLLLVPEEGGEECAWCWSMLAFYAVEFFRASGDMESAFRFHGSIRSQVAAYPDNQDIAREEVRSAFNFINFYGEAKEFQKCTPFYESICTLARKHIGSKEIALQQAMIGYNLVVMTIEAKDFISAIKYDNSISELLSAHQDNEEIALEKARASFFLFSRFVKSQYPIQINLYYLHLKLLAESYPNNIDIQFIYAKVTFNWLRLKLLLGLDASLFSETKAFRDLLDLYQDNPDFAEIVQRTNSLVEEIKSDPKEHRAEAIRVFISAWKGN